MLRSSCATSAGGCLDRSSTAGAGAELVHDFVVPVPTTVIAHLVGVPEEDYPLSAESSGDRVVQGSYPTKYRNERGEGLAVFIQSSRRTSTAVIARRRADPDPPQDFLARLLTMEVDGVRLTDVECRTQLHFPAHRRQRFAT